MIFCWQQERGGEGEGLGDNGYGGTEGDLNRRLDKVKIRKRDDLLRAGGALLKRPEGT